MREAFDTAQAVNEMIDWIKHPNEFGKEPESAKVVYKKMALLPDNESDAQAIYLVEFVMEGKIYIGFCGPTMWKWCFMDIDYAQFSKAELVEMYVGWMLCFIGKDLLDLKKSEAEKGKQKFMELLKMRFKKAVKVEVNAEAFMLGKFFFSAFVYFEDGSKKGFVADEDGLYQRIFKHVKFESRSLMLYRFLGWQFNPLDMS